MEPGPQAAKKSYTSPSFRALDAAAAKAELKAKGVPQDRGGQEMLFLMDELLNKRRAKSKSAS